MAHSPPDPLSSMRVELGVAVTLTLYLLLPTLSPVALPLKVQTMIPVVDVGQDPVPVPMTCQSSTSITRAEAGAAGVGATASPAPSMRITAISDFTERNAIDFSPSPGPFRACAFLDHMTEQATRLRKMATHQNVSDDTIGYYPSKEGSRAMSFDSSRCAPHTPNGLSAGGWRSC